MLVRLAHAARVCLRGQLAQTIYRIQYGVNYISDTHT